MLLLGNLLEAIGVVLGMLLDGLVFVVIAQAILSWVSPDPFNPIVRTINAITEPLLRPIRRYVPPAGGRIDFSSLILLLALYFVKYFIVQSLLMYAAELKGQLILR